MFDFIICCKYNCFAFGRKCDQYEIVIMDKDKMSSTMIMLIIILMLHVVSGTDHLVIDTYCPDNFPFYTSNTSFHKNLKLLMETLSSNIVASNTSYFNNTSIGQGLVYGQALCRGDITNSTVCKECIEKASKDLMNRCQSEDAMIWYELCQVRYSFQMFFSDAVYTGKYPKQNDLEKRVSDPTSFQQVLTYLMNNLSSEAAFNPATNMFATAEIEYTAKKERIYGLVECTKDVSETDCGSCLSSAVTELNACCSYREGGIIVSRNCNVRFDLFQFFNSSSAASLLIFPTSKGN